MNHERMLTLLIQDAWRCNASFLIIVVDFSGFSTKHPEMLGTELTIDYYPLWMFARFGRVIHIPSFTGEDFRIFAESRLVGRAEMLGMFLGQNSWKDP